MTTILGFLFNRFSFLILAIVIVVALVGAGKLVFNRYTIGGLLLLALGIGAWTWHDKKVDADRIAVAAPYIKQIKDMTAKRDAEIAALKLAADKATAENKAREQAWNDATMKAKDESTKRIKVLQANATAARVERDSLRSDLAAARSQMLRATIDSVRNYAATLSVVFDQCVGAYQELAGKADGHASDTQLIMSAWPTK